VIHQWDKMFSQSMRNLLAFARAVITNPELLCMHKPIMAYDEETSSIVLDMLKDFCVSKGVEQDQKSRHMRRVRTCIITAAKAASVYKADHVYSISHESGVRFLSPANLQEPSHLMMHGIAWINADSVAAGKPLPTKESILAGNTTRPPPKISRPPLKPKPAQDQIAM